MVVLSNTSRTVKYPLVFTRTGDQYVEASGLTLRCGWATYSTITFESESYGITLWTVKTRIHTSTDYAYFYEPEKGYPMGWRKITLGE